MASPGSCRSRWHTVSRSGSCSRVWQRSSGSCPAFGGVSAFLLTRSSDLRRAGSASGRRKRPAALALSAILLIPSAYIALAHGTPVVVDLITGPRTVTVSSCTHEMRTHRIKFGDYRGRPTFTRDFTMTLPDGTTRQTVIGLRQFGHAAKIEKPLFEACVTHDGETPMTLDVYYHSWVISGARLD